ncbi:lytic murein transglycosylase [Bauldia sp.]|uniref:lytic murein transglycosylase n=1 Tax=Bauldia sp. TaxID=2575872 RepID=UPI003BA98124
MMLPKRLGAAMLTAAIFAGSPAVACQKEPNFNAWLKGVAQEAAAAGVSQQAIQAGLGSARFDQAVVNKDRSQGVFSQTFLQFSDRMVEQYRVGQAPGKIRQYGDTFRRIEQQYGVPAEVIVAFWGLETDFGAVIGDGSTLNALATLAYDCRRPDLFREQLIAALKIIDRGDLTPNQMRGPWAGEMGQLQFLPSHYYDHGVDFDGSGRVDLLKSSPDALASAANYLASVGWRRGEPWLQEVQVPANFPWEMADLRIRLPRSEWVAAGVTAGQGTLANDGLEAALVLPMGRNGPAFLAYPNFYILLDWNSSLVYATTAAYFATRIDGAPRVSRGSQVNSLSADEVKRLQRILSRRGYDVGKVDGIIGERTRAAVKEVQLQLGLPADSYPTKELLAQLR